MKKLLLIALVAAGCGVKAQAQAQDKKYFLRPDYKYINYTITLSLDQWVELCAIMKASPTLKYQTIKFDSVIIEQLRKQLIDTTNPITNQ